MSALTAATLPTFRKGIETDHPVKAATTIYAGALVAINSSGYALPAADASGLTVIGTALETADNAAGAAGDIRVKICREVVAVTNGSNAITNAHIGKVVWIEDDNSVGTSPGTNNVEAGICLGIDADSSKVWVDPKIQNRLATAVTMTSTNGTAAAASASLANLAAEAEKIGDDVRAIYAALVVHGILS